MGANDLNKQIDHALAQLHEAMGRGQSQQLRQYLQAMARLPRYSLGNLLLIVQQKPDARRVAGARAWRRLGRSIRRGERGIRILAPVRRRRRETSTDHAEAEEERKAGMMHQVEDVRGFRPVVVFDVSQTHGQPLPDRPRVGGDPGGYLPRLEQYIQSLGIRLERLSSWTSADGGSAGGKIAIREGLEPAERLSVLVHELAHLCAEFGYVVPAGFGLKVGTVGADRLHITHRST